MYLVHMNSDMGNIITNCSVCLGFQQTKPKDKIILHNVQGRQWEVIGADILHIDDKNFLCIIDYFNKLPVIKCTERPSAENLIT